MPLLESIHGETRHSGKVPKRAPRNTQQQTTLIQIRNRGVRHGPAEVIQRLSEGEHVDPSEYYFRASPTFLVSPGPHDWLNKGVFVATGARYARAIELWFYRVT